MLPPDLHTGRLVNVVSVPDELVVEVVEVVVLSGAGVPLGIPVPHGGIVNGMLNVDGGGTRDLDEEASEEVEAMLEELIESDEEVMEVLEDDIVLDELAEGVGMRDIDRLDNMSAGISLLPSSSSSESGARVQAGPSVVLEGCSLSPSSSSSESGAREQDGPSVV